MVPAGSHSCSAVALVVHRSGVPRLDSYRLLPLIGSVETALRVSSGFAFASGFLASADSYFTYRRHPLLYASLPGFRLYALIVRALGAAALAASLVTAFSRSPLFGLYYFVLLVGLLCVALQFIRSILVRDPDA